MIIHDIKVACIGSLLFIIETLEEEMGRVENVTIKLIKADNYK